MGFTLFTAGIALQVAGEELDFEDGLRSVVGLGGDTDTNAAVAGALLGALHGVEAIPPDWLGMLVGGGTILEDAARLAALASA
jgi:ADP-ribosyl-[dinitrogen reductase] hydrolase